MSMESTDYRHCTRCDKDGHFARDCTTRAQVPRERDNVVCALDNACNSLRHYLERCPPEHAAALVGMLPALRTAREQFEALTRLGS